MKVTSINTIFTRSLLASVHADVKKFSPQTHLRKEAWVWCAGRDHWEFHGPDEFYWHGSAGDAYDARAKGWMAWMAKNGLGEYGRDDDDG